MPFTSNSKEGDPGAVTLSFGQQCHPGKVRTENQDRCTNFISPYGAVFVVADGMGGHLGGGHAAQLAIQEFPARFLQQTGPLRDALAAAAQHTNQVIFSEGHSGNPDREGMGATLVVAVINTGILTVGHIGDSRTYLYRGGSLMQITKDHTVAQRLADLGVISEAEVADHPDASVLTQALGQRTEIAISISEPIRLQPGDSVILCSDGLCGYVENFQIEASLRTPPLAPSQPVADKLLALALDAGGGDNITVQVVQYGSPAAVPLPNGRSSISRSNKRGMLVAGALAGFFVLTAAAASFWSTRAHDTATPAKPLTIHVYSEDAEPAPLPPRNPPTNTRSNQALPAQPTPPPRTPPAAIPAAPPRSSSDQTPRSSSQTTPADSGPAAPPPATPAATDPATPPPAAPGPTASPVAGSVAPTPAVKLPNLVMLAETAAAMPEARRMLEMLIAKGYAFKPESTIRAVKPNEEGRLFRNKDRLLYREARYRPEAEKLGSILKLPVSEFDGALRSRFADLDYLVIVKRPK